MSAGFVRPRTVDEALEVLGDDNAMPIAGGVAVGVLTNLGLVSASWFVAIGRLPGLRGVTLGDDGAELVLGAATPHARLADDPLLRDELPQAAGMFGHIGNIRVRNWGTVGGNLALAEPAQDPPVLLAALGADVVADGSSGRRRLPVATFAEGPMTTVLQPGELITQIVIPRLGADERCAYLKFLPTTADDYATVSAAVRLRLDGDLIIESRIFCGSVGPVPVDCAAAAALLVGRSAEADDRFDGVADAVADVVSPLTDQRGEAEYKREMAGVFVRRALERALAGGRPDGGRG
ncbi:MAG: FAD binding domain-containing protein [Pseudonocardia sp.]|nr:FAD binding domain-containing protein [Pseudonocardia sp.]MBO0877214.1 FAD binding domain-containing protein [Pseudonocardia sp.]